MMRADGWSAGLTYCPSRKPRTSMWALGIVRPSSERTAIRYVPAEGDLNRTIRLLPMLGYSLTTGPFTQVPSGLQVVSVKTTVTLLPGGVPGRLNLIISNCPGDRVKRATSGLDESAVCLRHISLERAKVMDV